VRRRWRRRDFQQSERLAAVLRLAGFDNGQRAGRASMGFAWFFNQWWNLPYLAALDLVGLWMAGQALGFLTHGSDSEDEADVDTDSVVDADGDGVPDVEQGHEHEHGCEEEHGHVDNEGDDDDGAGLRFGGSGLLGFLGVGQVPSTVVWVSLSLFFGFAGLFANRFLGSLPGGYRIGWFPVSLLVALLVGAGATRLVAQTVHRFVDLRGRGSTRRHELEGRPGTVASPRLDGEFGEVRVKDAHGHELLVHARLTTSVVAGQSEAATEAAPEVKAGQSVEQGSQVVLVSYDAQTELFTAAPLAVEGEAQQGLQHGGRGRNSQSGRTS
jgi:hypothetical protein